MGETERIMDQLLQQVKSTREFNQYQNLLQRVKAQPDLYRRIGEYRRRSIAAQMRNGEDFIAENNNVQKEFADLQNNGRGRDRHFFSGSIVGSEGHFAGERKCFAEQTEERHDLSAKYSENAQYTAFVIGVMRQYTYDGVSGVRNRNCLSAGISFLL